MSAWYVIYLIKNTQEIKNDTVFENDDNSYFNEEDRVYLDLLSVEMELANLVHMGIIDKKTNNLIQLVQDGFSIRNSAKQLGLDWRSATTMLSTASDRIAFALGENFTNDGFFNYILENYNLTETEKYTLQKRLEGVIYED